MEMEDSLISANSAMSTIEDVRLFLVDIKNEFWEIFAPKKHSPRQNGAPAVSIVPPSGYGADRAKELLNDSVKYWASKIGVQYGRIAIKDQKTRWGSCSTKGNLNFNRRLAAAPSPVKDYVVIHELCHLIEMNHSKKFWNEVSRFCPDHKAHRKWLREHGRELQSLPL